MEQQAQRCRSKGETDELTERSVWPDFHTIYLSYAHHAMLSTDVACVFMSGHLSETKLAEHREKVPDLRTCLPQRCPGLWT